MTGVCANYENWRRFCDKADVDVKSFDAKEH